MSMSEFGAEAEIEFRGTGAASPELDESGELENASGPGSTIDVDSDEKAAKRKLGFTFWVSALWLALVIGGAILAPYLAIKSPDVNFIQPGERPPYSPSAEHWFGTDQDARDMFSRTLYGARTSLTVGFAAIAFGVLVGGSLGLLAGYFRGKVDQFISFAFLTLLSFPALVLAILITVLLERSLTTIAIVIGILSVAPVGRVARATTISFADREFVLAAKSLGARHPRIIIRELLPNVLIPMGAFSLLGVAIAIVAEGSLAFLGQSVEKGPTWGKIILTASQSSRDLEKYPFMAFFPIMTLFLTVLALNFAGDRLRSYFDVKELSL
ncbi:MAG: peptide/nickel transport system permease protein [Candidatus Aldehydirespiratoraceae bacterium]|jgi:peptide/nickel transport system permease protein